MKRHISLLAFGIFISGLVVYPQVHQVSPSPVLASSSQLSNSTQGLAATVPLPSTGKPSISGGAQGGD